MRAVSLSSNARPTNTLRVCARAASRPRAARLVFALLACWTGLALSVALRPGRAAAQSSDTTAHADSTTPAKDTTAKPAGTTGQSICISCGPTDNPPTVSITPVGGTFTSGAVSVTIDWCDDFNLDASSRQITLNGVDVTAQFSYVPPSVKTCGAEERSVGTVNLRVGANTINAQILDFTAQSGADAVGYTYNPPGSPPSVTPDNSSVSSFSTVPTTQTFTVQNIGVIQAKFDLTASCPAAWSCPTSIAPVTLDSGASVRIPLTYTPNTSNTTGLVSLTAKNDAATSLTATGTIRVTVPLTAKVAAKLSTVNVPPNTTDSVAFTLTNTGPTATYDLSLSCTGSALTCFAPAPPLTAAPGATSFWVKISTGAGDQTGTLFVTARKAGDATDTASASASVATEAEQPPGSCLPGDLECPGNDQTPPVVAVRPATITQHSRFLAVTVDWCDNLTLDDASPSIMLNDTSVTSRFTYTAGNSAPTCVDGGAHQRSDARVELLPGTNTLVGSICDLAGNCGDTSATFTYAAFSVASADSTLLRWGAGSPFDQNFTVTNTGDSTYIFDVTGVCSATSVTACKASPGSVTLAPGASQTVDVSYQTLATAAGTAGSVSLRVAPRVNPNSPILGSVTVRVAKPVALAPVTPDSLFIHAAAGLANDYTFVLHNAGNIRSVYTLSVACAGTATGCKVASVTVPPARGDSIVSATQVQLAPGDSAFVKLAYNMGAVGTTGSIALTATTPNGTGTASDAGSLSILAQPLDLPIATLDSVWPGARVERSLCVTVAVGTGSTADECGDLRVAYALPAVRTLNKNQVPTLLYGSSDATATAVVPAWVDFLPGAAAPDSVTAVLLIGGVVRDRGMWAGSQWNATPAGSRGRQISLVVDGRTLTGGPGGATDHTGSYAATLQITSYRGAIVLADTLSTTVPIVDRSQSPWGAGWWLAGLERLYFPTDGTLTWVGGDGSLRSYAPDPAHPGIYRARSLTRPDSLVKDASGQYVRYLPNRLHVRFNSAGQHIATINRLGDSTVFWYDAQGRVSELHVAPVNQSKRYFFSYTATTGVLLNVQCPTLNGDGTPLRFIFLGHSGSLVTNIKDPDTATVAFTYDPAHVGRMLSATDRRGTTTTFSYDGGGKLASATIGMQGTVPDLTTAIAAAQTWGFRAAAVDTAAVAVRLNGPLAGDSDSTVIRVTPYGAPRRITDAHGHVTRLDYGYPVLPALVTHEHRLDVAASVATYDVKGHLLALTDSTTYVDSADGGRGYATTTYAWDAIWDEVTVIRPPQHDSTVITYNIANGNRLTEADAAGDTVKYGYTSDGRLQSVQRGTLPAEHLAYNVGTRNLESTTSPLGFVTHYIADRLGRDTLVTSPIDSAQTLLSSTRTVYDLMDHPLLTQSFGPALHFTLPSGASITTPPETLTVATVFDRGGLVTRVTRTATPDPAHIGPLTTSMTYDPAGRKLTDVATDGAVDRYAYDAASRLTQHTNRNDMIVTQRYDALGELLVRDMSGGTTPFSVTFDTAFAQWAPNDFAQGGDVATFTYDVGGRMLTANNSTAQITRRYNPNGTLATDSLRIGTWDGSGDFSRHVFGLGHSYDLDGRRTATSGIAGAADSVAYDLAGRLSGIRDASGHWFTYHYDAAGRPDSVLYANGGSERRFYDADDRLTRRVERVPMPADTALHDDTLSYDARGKLLRAGGKQEEDAEGYSALGTVWASTRDNRLLATFKNDETFTADPFGNVLERTVDRVDGGPGTNDDITSSYAAGTGRLLAIHGNDVQDTTLYTAAGDRAEVGTGSGNGLAATGMDRTHYYYRADGLLVAVDHRTCTFSAPEPDCLPHNFVTTKLTGAFEDYRYDALGRRVLVRTRMDSVCNGAGCVSSLLWVVWDGNQIAEEIRGPGHDGLSSDSLEAGLGTGPMYGTVAYLNGATIDEPLEIAGVIPYRTWRGLADAGSCSPSCDGPLGWDWPGGSYETYLSAIPSRHHTAQSWHGSLLAQGADDGGLMYRRNRYYDPATGQFTQEDPLGLAGGMNAYGFGSGDPINFDDPFGLSADDNGPGGGNRKPGKTPNKSWPTLPSNLAGKKPKWNPEGYWEGKGGSRLTWDGRSHGAGVDRGRGPQGGHWDDEASGGRWDENGAPLPGTDDASSSDQTEPTSASPPKSPSVPLKPPTPAQASALGGLGALLIIIFAPVGG